MPYNGEFHFTALRTLGTFRTMSASRRFPRSRFQPGIPAMYACTGASPSAFAMRGLPPDRTTATFSPFRTLVGLARTWLGLRACIHGLLGLGRGLAHPACTRRALGLRLRLGSFLDALHIAAIRRSLSYAILLTGPSFELWRQTSIYPRQYLLQVCKEPRPPGLGALVGLLLIRPETRLLHAQVGPRARRGESPSDDTLETIGTPRVRQRFVRLDCLDLAVNSAPVCAKIETVADDRLEVVLHEPLLDQVWVGESAPDLFRRKGYVPFDNDGERFGRRFGHWSILLSRSSR